MGERENFDWNVKTKKQKKNLPGGDGSVHLNPCTLNAKAGGSLSSDSLIYKASPRIVHRETLFQK